jgi:O-antigen/teichoic acid export membrane protein
MSVGTETSSGNEALRPHRTKQFLVDTAWTWASVIANLFTGLLLSPYIIRKLGSEGYGLWSLVFSIVGYYTVMDFGLRSAVITMTAEHSARGERQKINALLSTTFIYSLGVTAVLLAVSGVLTIKAGDWLNVSPAWRQPFHVAVGLAGVAVAISFSFNVISGCLEGLQQFSGLNRLRTGVLILRAIGSAVVLAAGFGLVALALCSFASYLVICAGYWWILRRALPGLSVRWRLAELSILKEAGAYGLHTTLAGAGSALLEQTPLVLIGRLLSAAAVGYYSLPSRMLQYPAEMVTRVTFMLLPIAAELGAKEHSAALTRLAILANRYSLILFGPFALILMTWGSQLIQLWVGAEYARESGPATAFFALGTWLAVAGQSSSVAFLFGLRRHSRYAIGLMLEGVALALAAYFLAARGVIYVAAASCLAMLLNRGILTSWLVSRKLEYSFVRFVASIYTGPLILAALLYLLLYQLHRVPNFGRTWLEMIVLGIAASLLYYVPAYFLCADPAHRQLAAHLVARAKTRLVGLAPRV